MRFCIIVNGGIAMKKVCWLLIITLLFGCLAACQSAGTQKYGAELTQEQREEISNAWFALYRYEIPWYDENNIGGTKYLGSENGYAFLFEQSGFCVPWNLEIAGYYFEFSSQFHLYAYKDGEFYSLKNVYESGNVTTDAIQAMHTAFTAHLKEAYGYPFDN